MNPSTSSDDLRNAKPLRHAQTWTSNDTLELENGARLPEPSVCFETWGTLNPTADNAVLICHAVSGDSHVARHHADDDPGWWDLLVGPGKPIDTSRYFVICANVLGGCRGTTGPNFVDPASGRPYGADFPVITVADMVELQRQLVDSLGVERLRCVVGGSLGGLQALTWAAGHPDRVASAIVIAAAPRLSSQGIAFDIVGRNAIRQDANFAEGQYYGSEAPEAGLALARMLAHITYLSDESMRAKFDPTRLQPRAVDSAFESTFSVGSYLAHQGDRFVERFDANSYITLSTAMDLFDLGDTQETRQARLAPSTCRWLFLSFSSDWLYPPSASRQLSDTLVGQSKSVSSCEITSPAGHDSFLLPQPMELGGRMVASFLASEPAAVTPTSSPDERRVEEPTSIFYADRLDYEMILRLLPRGASVVDLGCGDGELLSILRERGHTSLLGVERDQREVAKCIARGLDVIHADVDQGIAAVPNQRFDVALLSQTLQSIVDVAGVLDELVRIGGRAIVSFPNFAHAPLRDMFMKQGRLPKEEGLYAYDWHDTPNRRFPSILDFQELCEGRNIRIVEAIYVDSKSGREIETDPNLNADIAVVALTR
ncbi:MAG: homoserine O-acetyltransferase [Candidatus Binatia bacterium]|nr:homoserine O-acetyltransferase [Candidatus Binatia bacterium]